MSASIDLTEQSVFICGNSAAVKWVGKGRSHAGKDFSFEGIDVIDCDENGKIVKVYPSVDPSSHATEILNDLGANAAAPTNPAPAAPASPAAN